MAAICSAFPLQAWLEPACRLSGATPRSRWCGACGPRRAARTASRRRTGGAALAFCAWVLWRRRGLCEGLPRACVGGRVLPRRRRSFVNPLDAARRWPLLRCNAERGSASHEVLARLDFRGLCDGSEVSLSRVPLLVVFVFAFRLDEGLGAPSARQLREPAWSRVRLAPSLGAAIASTV